MVPRFIVLVLCLFLLSATIVYFAAPPSESQKVSDRQKSAECLTDTDCVPAGCSGQVCTTIAQASDLITTCEFRPEYACLQFTSCGCQQGLCQWAETEQYAACLSQSPEARIVE